MKDYVSRLILIIACALTGLLVSGVAVSAAADPCAGSNLSTGQAIQCGATGANGGNGTTPDVDSTIKTIINVLSSVVGVLAVIMIIIGGFRYITSGGSSEKVTAAKNTIIYALIGLIIVALAQVIVRFVLDKTAIACVNGKTDTGQKC